MQTPCDLDHEVLRETQVMESLMKSVDGTLSLLVLALVSGFGIETLTAYGFGVFVGVSFG